MTRLDPRAPRAARRLALVLALACLAAPIGAGSAHAYADRAGTDVVLDAPWRTVRDTLPVLFFFPQFTGGRTVECLRVREWVDGAPIDPPVLVDRPGEADTLNGTTFVGAMGEARGALGADERVTSFWHFVARIPHAALAHHASPDVHYLLAEVQWRRPGVFGRRIVTSRVLRVLVTPTRFPALGAGDRYADVHVHTIAEQSGSGTLDVDGAHKAYGGPIVMLVESAWALGLVETRPVAGDWRALADSLVVTDHNVFYSSRPYEAGVAPRAGPTSVTDGGAGEAAWYRANLGRGAGEEITLARGSNQAGKLAVNLGHHLLAYDTRHFEGPWHGGLVLTSRLENPNTLDAVLAGMRAAGGGGFAYAAHPNLSGFVWPPEYYARGIGLPPHNTLAGPAVDASGTRFLWRGSQVWNIKMDEVARGSGHLPASSAFDAMNPFAGGPAAQRFQPFAWDDELRTSLDTLFAWIGRGLDYSFRERPGERFVRKLFMSAGSDAHGDFNYTDEVTATAVPYSGWLHANAFGRVRTCALLHDEPPGRGLLDALREGTTVLTDGPLCTIALDGEGRLGPASADGRWLDAQPGWRDADGTIGGSGVLDGGRTCLVVVPGGEPWLRTRWLRSATPGAGPLTQLRIDRITASGRDTFAVPTGAEGANDTRPLPVAIDRVCALVATARDPVVGERCITNPVWVVPVRVAIDAPARAASRTGTALPAGALRVTFRFPISMSADAGSRARLVPLDADGRDAGPAIALRPAPGWEDEDGVAHARLTLVNGDDVPLPAGEWDADAHARAPGARSFAVVLERPTDVHGNALNDIGRTFVLRLPAADGAGAP